jgi:gliding motility-associated-like protein
MKKRNTTYFLMLILLFGTQLGYSKNIPIEPPTKKSTTIVAPTITATGNFSYCPSTKQEIVSTVNLIDPDNLIIEIYIQISAGYVNGQDKLIYTGSNPAIGSDIFDVNTGKIRIFKTGTSTTLTDFENAIKDIKFVNSAPSPGTRNFSITIGQANYLPRNKHFYRYISRPGIRWTEAKVEAESPSNYYYGLHGYLATLTAADEAQLAGKQASGAGWIGGSDNETEGVWKWVTGPEAGTIMTYTNWNSGEPNDYGDGVGSENYAHITTPGMINGTKGSWNDLPDTGDTNPTSAYYPLGYIVEYGGMVSGDVDSIQISASTTLTMSGKITTTNPSSNCGAGSVTLGATASYGAIEWYTTATGGTPLSTGNSFTTPNLTTTTNYYVSTGCPTNRTLVTATINPLPIVQNTSIPQCDTDLISDGKTVFNLTVNNDLISSNYTNESFAYYTTLAGAINNNSVADVIPNQFAFENTTPTSMPIGVRVFNSVTGCSAVAQITLIVPTTNFHPSSNFEFTICDDFLDTNGNSTANNNNRDGIATFDFSSTRATILGQLPSSSQNYTVNYYRNQADALSQLNAITDIANYRNIGYPNAQDIWVRIETDIANSCVGVGPYIRLNVEALPIANHVIIPRACDTNHNGIVAFNTTILESTLLNGQSNVSVRYVDQNNNPLKDANGILISSPFLATFSSTAQTIKAIVTNTSPQHCFDETSISFYVDAIPTATAISTNLTTVCDDEVDPANQDGKYAFDTSTFETTILAGQTGMTVKYYDQNNILLPSPLPNPFITATQNVTVVVENPINTNCSATTTIPFIVHRIPNIELNSTQLICSNIPTFFVTLDAGFLDNSSAANFNYNWKKDGAILNITTPTLGVNSEGNYTVGVTNQSGCSTTRSIQVTASNIATITSIDIVDLVDSNTVTINTAGPGDYEYSMDYLNGLWQDSNFFSNVPGGIHEIFVNDKNGCGVVSKEITVLSIPKFFTPNNDSYNDFWTVKGMISYPNAELRIFDRYGKLLKELRPTSLGWDGTFNGQELPASDYWYVFKMDATAPEKRGHFSLKR